MGLTGLLQSLVWLLAGVGVFIVGMNFLSEALEKCAGEGMRRLLGRISDHRLSGVGIGAAVTALIQSSSATSVMVLGLVNAGAMSLMQATPIIMGANIGTTVTGLLIALKNDYFNLFMYLSAFVGVMLGFFREEKAKIAGLLLSGLGLIFVGLNIMSSEQAFGSPPVEALFREVFRVIDFPLLLVLVGTLFTALIQSSSAATGVVITMVGTGIMPLELALFIVMGANIGTCATTLLASLGANANAKRIAWIHLAFNVIGTVIFGGIVWMFQAPAGTLLMALFPGSDPMSLQMRLSAFHVLFNLSTTCLLLPFTGRLVRYSCRLIKSPPGAPPERSLKYLDDRLLTMPPVALMQVKKEMDYMFTLAEENIRLAFQALEAFQPAHQARLLENEAIIDFTNDALTKFLITLSPTLEQREERVIGSYFHVINDLERIGDHAESFCAIAGEMSDKRIAFSEKAWAELQEMCQQVLQMLPLSRAAFDHFDRSSLPELAALEDRIDDMKRELTANHFLRLAEGDCAVEVSPYFSSLAAGLERVADHLVNIGYSIVSPIGSQKEI